VSTPNAPADAAAANAFCRKQHTTGADWHRKCLQLAREARRLPAVYPTALAAANATPKTERIYEVSRFRRGMVLYYDDPNDSNAAAHVATMAGWKNNKITGRLSDTLVWSPDVIPGKEGAVGLVAGDYFPRYWGDPLLFAATWLNGYNFADLDRATVPPGNPLGSDFDAAIAAIEKSIRAHRKAGHTRIVAALVQDLAELRETRAKFPTRG